VGRINFLLRARFGCNFGILGSFLPIFGKTGLLNDYLTDCYFSGFYLGSLIVFFVGLINAVGVF